MKRLFSLIMALVLIVLSLSACLKANEQEEFDTLSDITDLELYKDATTLKFNIVKFGKQQDEDITWYLVESYKDYRVLLSEKILDFKQYNDSGIDVNFEDSSIYRYMENDFLDEYFSNDEKKKLLSYTDGLKVALPTLDNLREYFGEVSATKSGYYGDPDFFAANTEMVAKPAESSTNEALVDNVFDNHYYSTKNEVEMDTRYNFADGCQPYWIYDGNELYVNFVTATGYVARTNQDNQYIGFRPMIKVRK